VKKVEGSSSYKAIAFIKNNGNRRNNYLKLLSYFKLSRSLYKEIFSKIPFRFGKSITIGFREEFGDKNV